MRNEYVVASSTNELFENVDIRNVHNLLNRRFRRCSIGVKLQLFKTVCVCFYDIGLWSSFSVGTLNTVS